MIKSMTGYGRYEMQFDEYKITVELKSVNNRYLDYNIRMYKQYLFLEEISRACISQKIKRGKVDVFVQFDNVSNDDKVVTLNEELAQNYCTLLRQIADKFSLSDDVTVSKLASFSDIFTIEKKEQDKEKITKDFECVLKQAVDDLVLSRQREGERLCAFFKESISKLRQIIFAISQRSPKTVEEYRQKINDRVHEMLGNTTIDENRILTEVLLYADKVNVTEETVRFESHLSEFESLLLSDDIVGKKLDFIVQELNREANTIGSKCNDITISKDVVELKTEIEKIREQVQNIE